MRPTNGTPVGLRNRRTLRVAASALNRWNARHPWNHNDHFHRWILRNLPEGRLAALDVGCGRGALVEKLAERFEHVTGIDPDATMVAVSRELLADRPEIEIRQQPFLDATGRYDLVTMVASLHHMPLESSLRHAAGLLAPGGRLLVVGLAQLGSPADIAFDGASLLLNPLVGFVKHPRPERGPAPVSDVPLRDPEEDFTEIRSVAERVLPGAEVRRRLFFRYTLRWDSR